MDLIYRSIYFGYGVQRILIEKVVEIRRKHPSNVNSYLLLRLIEHYLKVEYNSHENVDNAQLNFYTFSLVPDQVTFEYRIMLWNALFDLYRDRQIREPVLKVLHKYALQYLYRAPEQIIENDFSQILPFINKNMKGRSYYHCEIVQTLCGMLDKHNIEYDTQLRIIFSNEIYQLKELLFVDIYEMKDNNLKWDDYQELRKRRIKEHCKNYSLNNFKRLIKNCILLFNNPVSERDQYQLQEGLTEVFLVLSETSPKLLFQVARYYISINNPVNIYPPSLVYCLLKCFSRNEVNNLIVRSTEKLKKTRRKMMFAFYECLSEEQIIQSDVKEIMSLYNQADADDPPTHTDYLLKYQKYQESLIPQICKLVLKQIEKDINYTRNISMLFNPFSEAGKRLSQIFKRNKSLAKKLFFVFENSESASDLNDKIFKNLYDLDSSILQEYIKRLYTQNNYITSYQDHIEYSFLWSYDDYISRISRLLEYLRELERKKDFYASLYAERVFKIRNGEKDWELVIERQNKYLRK